MEFDFNKNLYISQVITTIQGEGPLSGVPSLLIRLSGCDLHCPWCDTKYTWNHTGNHPGTRIVSQSNFDEFIDYLDEMAKSDGIKNLMITGGEPLLYWNNPMFQQLINGILSFDYYEIETNGVLLGEVRPGKYDVRFNISPKLDPKSYTNKLELSNLHLTLNNFFRTVKSTSILKFVDVPELRPEFEAFLLNISGPEEIRLMPWTPDRTKFNSYDEFLKSYHINCLDTLKYCMEMGYTYTQRLHLYLFDNEDETY